MSSWSGAGDGVGSLGWLWGCRISALDCHPRFLDPELSSQALGFSWGHWRWGTAAASREVVWSGPGDVVRAAVLGIRQRQNHITLPLLLCWAFPQEVRWESLRGVQTPTAGAGEHAERVFVWVWSGLFAFSAPCLLFPVLTEAGMGSAPGPWLWT